MKTRPVFSSDFEPIIACGVNSNELAEYIRGMIDGKNEYLGPGISFLKIESSIVSVTAELDWGKYYVRTKYNPDTDQYVGRSLKEEKIDNDLAKSPQEIAKVISCIFPKMASSQKEQIVGMLNEASKRGNTDATTYNASRDDIYFYSAVDWDFSNTCTSKDAYNAWMEQYGKYVEMVPNINFDEASFAFLGLTEGKNEKDHPIVKKVLKKGGQYKSKITNSVNYIVADPRYADELMTLDAIETVQKNRNVKIILLEEFEKILEGIPISKVIIENGVLKKYIGNEDSFVVPSEVKEIGRSAFSGNTFIKKIVLPEGLIKIGYFAFEGCSSLCNINIVDTILEIGVGAFRGCKGMADANGFVIVCGKLFGYFGLNTHVTIPECVTDIGTGTFEKNKNLISITIPNGVRNIENFAFNGCENLANITIPEGMVSIGDYAFLKCKSLNNIIFPDSLTSIGDSAFDGCNNLTNITFPDGLKNIGSHAFSCCNGLAADVNGFVIVNGFLLCYRGRENNVAIPNSVTVITGGAFSSCMLKSVIVPDSVTCIEDYAFSSISSLESISIPNSVKKIGTNAFWNSAHCTIHTPAGSAAEKYAKKKKIPYCTE